MKLLSYIDLNKSRQKLSKRSLFRSYSRHNNKCVSTQKTLNDYTFLCECTNRNSFTTLPPTLWQAKIPPSHHTPPISYTNTTHSRKLILTFFTLSFYAFHPICFYKTVIYDSHRVYLYPHSSLMYRLQLYMRCIWFYNWKCAAFLQIVHMQWSVQHIREP